MGVPYQFTSGNSRLEVELYKKLEIRKIGSFLELVTHAIHSMEIEHNKHDDIVPKGKTHFLHYRNIS